MDTERDEQNYKGFDLTAYAEAEKVIALIDHLELNGESDTIEEDTRTDIYSVNQCKVKSGDSPQKYVEVIDALKQILTSKQRDKINSFLKLLGEMEECECGRVKDKIYKSISKSLELKKATPEYKLIETHSGHVVNVLYHLLWLPDRYEKEEPNYVKNYREAWFGRTPTDFREWNYQDDGEYLVLTDSEADRRAEDYFDSEGEYMWKQAVQAGSTMKGYNDWVEEVIGNDGRGSLLANYDGCENEQQVDGEWYYIYRTN